MGKQGNESTVYSRNIGYDQKVEYNTDGRQIYVGFAYPETRATVSDEKWSIYKLAYDTDGRVTDRRYANNTDDFIHSWSNRAIYSYLDI